MTKKLFLMKARRRGIIFHKESLLWQDSAFINITWEKTIKMNKSRKENRLLHEQRENYRGKEIVIWNGFMGPQLLIDEFEVDVSLDDFTGRYATHYLPYTDYESPLNLAKHLIDSRKDI